MCRKRDGITNPALYVNDGSRRSPSNLGHTAQLSDDDGGYLRLKVRAYFTREAKLCKSPAALSS